MPKKPFCIFALFLLILSTSCGTSRFRSPKVIEEKKLDYPLSAMLDRVEGNAVVGVFVSEKGKALEVRLLESSSSKDLDNAALNFAKEIHFEPALLDNTPVGAWTKLIMKYKLTDVYFEKDNWLVDVEHFISKASKEDDFYKKEIYLKKLYAKYYGLVNYVNIHTQDIRINTIISPTLLPEINEQYEIFKPYVPIQFAVFHDFLLRFPDSEIAVQAKEDLLKQLVETEFRLRIKGLESSSYARKTLHVIEGIELRIKELQKIEQ